MKVVKLAYRSHEQLAKQIGDLKSEISMLKKISNDYVVKYQSFNVNEKLD
jgi:hypothetical protein